MTVRQQVADAINAANIDGVTGSVYPPQTKRPGTTWAQWITAGLRQMITGKVVRDDDAWQVICLLPDVDPQQTADALDTWQPLILQALAPHFRLQRATATSHVISDGQAIPALSIAFAAP